MAFSKTTAPEGVVLPELLVTAPLRATVEPTVPLIEDGESEMLVLIKLGVAHLLIRFATLTEPSPAARS